MCDDFLDTEERALYRHRGEAAKLGHVEIDQRSRSRNAGVGHQPVDASVPRDSIGDYRIPIPGLSDIKPHIGARKIGRDRYAPACADQRNSRRPDARSGTGDKDDLAVQAHA